MAEFDIENIKSKLNVYNAQDNIQDARQIMHIEITLTDACNMRCKYCFEHDHTNKSNPIEEARQLDLISNACIDFDTTKFKELQIVFWGGEPMLNMAFMRKIIETTNKYAFVNYFMYSNGTLVDNYQEFVNDKLMQSVKNRFKIQISYDGEPINTLERGIDGQLIVNTAHLLVDNGFLVSFKATASYNTIKYIPQAWKSYEKLHDQLGDIVNYNLTIDMTSTNLDKSFEIWKTAVLKIMAYEYSFVKQHGHFLMSWLNYEEFNDNKMACSKDYSCHLHTNGDIYICHGCAYCENNQNLLLGKTNSIESIDSIMKKQKYDQRPIECFDCGAVFCNVCHIYNIDKDNVFGTWLGSMNKNAIRCAYFKYFGFIKKIFDFVVLSSGKNALIRNCN